MKRTGRDRLQNWVFSNVAILHLQRHAGLMVE